MEDKLEIVKTLIDNKANIHAKCERGQTLLMRTINMRKNHLKIAELLIEKGIKIDEEDKYGVTILMKAAAYGNYIGLLKLLIKNGADINVKTKDGKTALKKAEEFKKSKIVELLKKTALKKEKNSK